MLSGIEVAEAIDEGRWFAWRDGKPIKSDALHIGGVSIDATMGNRLVCVTVAPGWPYIDLHEPNSMDVREVAEEAGRTRPALMSPKYLRSGESRHGSIIATRPAIAAVRREADTVYSEETPLFSADAGLIPRTSGCLLPASQRLVSRRVATAPERSSPQAFSVSL